ncbi:MAG: hypothetical protein JSS32_09175 [Verrucomicrobia bacterium]|nr:hypothetical protein [Verrucomicrobiota bacterium]
MTSPSHRIDPSSDKWNLSSAASRGAPLTREQMDESGLKAKIKALIASPQVQALLNGHKKFTVRVSKGHIYLHVNGEKHDLTALNHAAVSTQNVAQKLRQKYDDFHSQIDKAQTEANKKSPLHKFAPVHTAMGWIIDTFSAIRNPIAVGQVGATLNSTASFTAPLMKFGIAGTALGTISGTIGTGRGIYRLRKAWKLQDGESGLVHGVTTAASASYTAVSASATTTYAAALKGAAATAKVASKAAGWAGVALGSAVAAYGAIGYKMTRKFANELDANMKSADPIKERLAKSLYSLRSKITLTDEESAKTPEEKEKILQKKWNAFSRRTSDECLEELMKKNTSGGLELDSIIAGVESGDVQQVAEAKKLLRKVYEENYRAKVKYITFIMIGIISVVAFCLGLAFTGGTANILFAAGALLWLAVDSPQFQKFLGDRLWKWRSDAVLPDALKTAEDKKNSKNLAAAMALSLTILLGAVPITLGLEGKSFYEWLKEQFNKTKGYSSVETPAEKNI